MGPVVIEPTSGESDQKRPSPIPRFTPSEQLSQSTQPCASRIIKVFVPSGKCLEAVHQAIVVPVVALVEQKSAVSVLYTKTPEQLLTS